MYIYIYIQLVFSPAILTRFACFGFFLLFAGASFSDFVHVILSVLSHIIYMFSDTWTGVQVLPANVSKIQDPRLREGLPDESWKHELSSCFQDLPRRLPCNLGCCKNEPVRLVPAWNYHCTDSYLRLFRSFECPSEIHLR